MFLQYNVAGTGALIELMKAKGWDSLSRIGSSLIALLEIPDPPDTGEDDGQDGEERSISVINEVSKVILFCRFYTKKEEDAFKNWAKEIRCPVVLGSFSFFEEL